MHGEHPDSSGDDSRCARDDGRVVNQPLARDDGMVRGFKRIQGETTVRKHMGRTLGSFANRDSRIPDLTLTGPDYITFWSGGLRIWIWE